jgi:hypothetical protein
VDRPADSRVVSLLRQVAGAPAVQRGPRLDAIGREGRDLVRAVAAGTRPAHHSLRIAALAVLESDGREAELSREVLRRVLAADADPGARIQAMASLAKLGRPEDRAAIRERLQDPSEGLALALAAARRLAVLEGQAVSADLQALRRRLIDQGVKPDSPSLRGLDRIIARAAGGRAAPARSGRREIVN